MNHGENAVPRPTGNIFVRVAVLVLLIAAFVLLRAPADGV